jgi:hypothetical protein
MKRDRRRPLRYRGFEVGGGRDVDLRTAWGISLCVLIGGLAPALTGVPVVREVGIVAAVLGALGAGMFLQALFFQNADLRSPRDWLSYRWWNRGRDRRR